MTEPQPITDRDSLRTGMTKLLKEAHCNDVEVEGGLTIRTPAQNCPDWEVQVWEIE